MTAAPRPLDVRKQDTLARLEHDEQRQPDRIRLYCFEFRIRYDVVREPRRVIADRQFGSPAPRTQHVETDPPDHGGQPAPQVADAAWVAAVKPQPCFLHRVLGFAERAKHAVGDRLQVRAALLELPGQPVLPAHLSPLHVAITCQ